MPTLAIDAMSGDLGAPECVPGALLALEQAPDLHLELVGAPATIEPLLATASAALRARISIVPASDVVPMDELPRAAIRHRKASSMRIAVDRVKAGSAAGCVSAGNTGALTAIAHFVLKTVSGVERAPIMSALPAAHGFAYMLDLGANITASAEQLRQFALMGSIVARDVFGVAQPRVGLLNVGSEDIKGHETVQAANVLIAGCGVHYLGFIEGDDIFSGKVDVVVTDGFTGNVALKSMEGLARLITGRMRTEFMRSTASRVAALFARPVLKRVGATLDPRQYNGACMVGLRGVVVKSHGRADRTAFGRAIALARTAAIHDIPGCVERALGSNSAQQGS